MCCLWAGVLWVMWNVREQWREKEERKGGRKRGKGREKEWRKRKGKMWARAQGGWSVVGKLFGKVNLAWVLDLVFRTDLCWIFSQLSAVNQQVSCTSLSSSWSMGTLTRGPTPEASGRQLPRCTNSRGSLGLGLLCSRLFLYLIFACSARGAGVGLTSKPQSFFPPWEVPA